MGRGGDSQVTPSVERRNPFRQEILNKEEFDRAEAQRKQREAEEEERRRREEAEALARAEEAEQQRRFLQLEQERSERRAELSSEEQARIKKREDFLRSRGLEVFDPNSPADGYVEKKTPILPEEYPARIERIDDPLLQEDGKNFAFSVRDGDGQEEKGFTESEAAAQEIIDVWIEADISQKIEELKDAEAKFLQEQSYERQKAAKEKITDGLPLSEWGFVDHLRRVPKVNCAERIFDERTTDLSRQEISGFDVLTYKFDGNWQIVVFRNGKLSLQTSVDNKLVPIFERPGYYEPEYSVGDPIANLPTRRGEQELMKEALHIAEEKHGATPFAGGLPGITKGQRDKKEKESSLREEARKKALSDLRVSEEERVRQGVIEQAKEYIKSILAEETLENI